MCVLCITEPYPNPSYVIEIWLSTPYNAGDSSNTVIINNCVQFSIGETFTPHVLFLCSCQCWQYIIIGDCTLSYLLLLPVTRGREGGFKKVKFVSGRGVPKYHRTKDIQRENTVLDIITFLLDCLRSMSLRCVENM